MEPIFKNDNESREDENDAKESNHKDDIKIFIHSWNMGNAPMNYGMIAEELVKKDVVNSFQIVCFGLQESTYTMHTTTPVDNGKSNNNTPNNTPTTFKATNGDSNNYYNINSSTNGSAAASTASPDGKGKKASAGNDCTHEVQAAFEQNLGPRFKRIAHLRRGQMQMFMFARDDVLGRISQVEKSVENTGFLGIFPNKGTNQCAS
jgi:hypothetical protein